MENYPKKPSFPPVKYELQIGFGSVYDGDEKKAILEVLENNIPTSGPKCAEFERLFAEYIGTKYSVAVSNGTAALLLAFKAIGIGPGDEIITTPVTWIATAAAAAVLGADVIFCDVDPATMNMDPSHLETLITERTRAIVPVHLYGQPVDMDPVIESAEKHNLYVIEDAAHAPGGSYKGKKTGSIGHIGCFSFHEQKNMATGEGGMVVTDDPELFERIRLYRSHCARVIGGSNKYLPLPPDIAAEKLEKLMFWFQDFDDCGYNFRINDMTAAIGICQLHKLDGNNAARRRVAEEYRKLLEEIPHITPLEEKKFGFHTYHLFPVYLEEDAPLTRNEFIYELARRGIKTGVHYMPLTATSAFRKRGYTPEQTPIAWENWQKLVTLPIHPRITDEGIEYLTDVITELMEK